MANKEQLQEIIDEIVSFSDGVFHIDRPEEYDTLTTEEQQFVDDEVFKEIGECADCGWHFHYQSLETVDSGEEMCMTCASIYYTGQEE